MENNKEIKDKKSIILGTTGRIIAYGRPVHFTLSPNDYKNIWENKAKKIAEILNIPMGWNGKSFEDPCIAGFILNIGCIEILKYNQIAEGLGRDKIQFITTLCDEISDDVVSKFKKHPELIEKSNVLDDEIKNDLKNIVMGKLRKIASKRRAKSD